MSGPPTVYLNNAATSWPKPPEVAEEMARAVREPVASPARSSETAGDRLVFAAREELAAFIGCRDSSRVVFTASATEALNLAILGSLRPGDHALSTSMDHNSVSRPLARAAAAGAAVEAVPADPDGSLPAHRVLERVTERTRLVVLTHASNVTGTLQPVEEVAASLARLGEGRPLLLVDAAQTAGVLPLAVEETGIDLLAAPGHKGLLGPQGTGFLYVGPRAGLLPLKEGGTGGNSTSERQPDELPERFEAGTPNTPGIAGLAAGVRHLVSRGPGWARKAEEALTDVLLEVLAAVPGLAVHGPRKGAPRVAVVSFTFPPLDPAEIATFLSLTRGIVVRVGLHCSPAAHRTIGTFPVGTVRVSPGVFNHPRDLALLGEALRELARMRGSGG